MSTPAPTAADRGDTPAIHPVDLREQLSGKQTEPRLLDVRTPAEYESAHIPGSVNVPLDLVHASPAELREVLGGQEVVLVCRSGARAEQARKVLAEAGLTSTWVLSGGVSGWESVGGDLNRGRTTWELERQVRLAAGSLVLLGVLGSVLVPGLQWLAAFVGGGLVFAAVTNTCALGMLIARMPWNRKASSGDPMAALVSPAGGGRS